MFKQQQRRAPQNLIRREHVSSKTKGLEFILSDATPDRYNDIIKTSGWELTQFKRNPIALFAHRGDFPIGLWKDVRVEDNALRGSLVLAPRGTSGRIDEIHSLIDADVLKAVSVGFTPIAYEERKGDEYGIVYTKQELVECSLVSVPANPNALQVAKALKISSQTQGLVFAGLGSAKPKSAPKKKKTIRSEEEVEQCIIDLLDSGQVDDEDEARQICEELYDGGD